MIKNFAITLILIVTFSIGLFSQAAHAAAAYEMQCRAKAKELAAEAYRSCVTENKTAQIEQIRKEYQAKLNALKAHYENKMTAIGGKKTAAKRNSVSQTIPRKEKTTTMTFEAPEKTPPENSSEETMEIPEPVPVESENL